MVTVAGQRGWFPIPAAGAVGGVTGGLLMVRVCGMLSSRVCGLLGSVCGSVGLAVLVVALAAMASASVPPQECKNLCLRIQNNEAYFDCMRACLGGAPYVCGDNATACLGSSCPGLVGLPQGCGQRGCGDTRDGYLCAQYCTCRFYPRLEGGFICHCVNR
jgi:hypothetical protein